MIYDYIIKDVFKQLLPPDLRKQVNCDFGAALVKPLQWNHSMFFRDYLDGTNATEYNNSSTYAIFDLVRYNNKTYQLIETESTGILPTNATYWYEVNKDFRGARHRVTYNGQKLVLEYILNKWFGTTFIPRPEIGGALSSIYIQNVQSATNNFFVGESSPNTSFVASYGDIQEYFVPATSSVYTVDFKVFYPVSLIPSDTNPIYKQLVAIAEKFKLYGTKIGYQSY